MSGGLKESTSSRDSLPCFRPRNNIRKMLDGSAFPFNPCHDHGTIDRPLAVETGPAIVTGSAAKSPRARSSSSFSTGKLYRSVHDGSPPLLFYI
jgi:hypothetical protein